MEPARQQWERHPNITGPAGVLLQIHDGFRRASRFLVTEARAASPDWTQVGRVWRDLSRVLHHHHHAEEVLLFPRLADAAELQDDHRRLTAAIAAVEAVGPHGPDALAELERFDALLVAHLDAEESLAIPHLLDSPWF